MCRPRRARPRDTAHTGAQAGTGTPTSPSGPGCRVTDTFSARLDIRSSLRVTSDTRASIAEGSVIVADLATEAESPPSHREPVGSPAVVGSAEAAVAAKQVNLRCEGAPEDRALTFTT